jgi:hypothetical protein
MEEQLELQMMIESLGEKELRDLLHFVRLRATGSLEELRNRALDLLPTRAAARKAVISGLEETTK